MVSPLYRVTTVSRQKWQPKALISRLLRRDGRLISEPEDLLADTHQASLELVAVAPTTGWGTGALAVSRCAEHDAGIAVLRRL